MIGDNSIHINIYQMSLNCRQKQKKKSHFINLWKYILLDGKMGRICLSQIFKFVHLTLSALTSDDDDVIPNGDGGNEIRLRVNKGSWVGIAKISSSFGGLHEPVQFANI